MQANTTGSNVLSFPARSGPRRFGRPRYSSLYLLGAWLFNRTLSGPVTTITRLVVDARSHFADRARKRHWQIATTDVHGSQRS